MQSNITFFDLLERIKGLSVKAKMVYLYIYHSSIEGRQVVGQEMMIKDLELSQDSVHRGLKELREQGFVTWKIRGLTLPSVYQLVPLVDPGTHLPEGDKQP